MSEHSEQVALFEWASTRQSVMPELAYLFAVPNGGYRAKSTAARLKAEGLKPGVPDLFLPVPRGGWCGLWLEMKYGRGKLSDNQARWLIWLKSQGYHYDVCFKWENAAAVIESYLDVPIDMRTLFFT